MSALEKANERLREALLEQDAARRIKAKRGFMQRTLQRMQERGIDARELYLYSIALIEAENVYRDRRIDPQNTERGETVRGRVLWTAELLTERDFGYGMANDLMTVIDELGTPRFTKQMRQDADMYVCFIGRNA